MTVGYSATDTASVDAMLERLIADHRRFTDALDLLQASAARLRASTAETLDAEVVRDLVGSLRAYVDGGHHVVEEVMFSALVDGGIGLEAEAAILGLREDHEQLASRAAAAIDGLQQLVSGTSAASSLLPRIVDFCQYERYHMKMESDHVFPEIRERLAGDHWGAVRRELAARLPDTASQ